MSNVQADAGEMFRGPAGLAVKGGLYDGKPVVEGQWGEVGLGYRTWVVREVCRVLLAACDQAEALAPGGTDA